MNIYSEMLGLFEECLRGGYTEGKEGGSWRAERSGGRLSVFFEGSNGSEDWLNNLDFPCVPYSDMPCRWYCHRGFARVFKAIIPSLEPILLDTSVTDVTICGYSHGGALALLCHEYVWYGRSDLRGDRLRSFAFGAPRVIFAPRGICMPLEERFDGLWLVRNLGDIVTHLPPLWLGYTHPRAPLAIGERGRYSPIDAHRPESYIAELSAAANRIDTLYEK